jgi:hypothetical protein
MSTIKVPKLTRGQLNCNTKSEHKVCYVCKEEKPYSEFGTNNTRSDGLQTYCKKCAKEKQSEWYYQRTHGLNLKERDSLLEAQDGRCAICGSLTEFQFKKGKHTNTGEYAVVDHCHDSKKIRGILCGHCNTGLGAFKDDISRLNAAIEYLILADNT